MLNKTIREKIAKLAKKETFLSAGFMKGLAEIRSQHQKAFGAVKLETDKVKVVARNG